MKFKTFDWLYENEQKILLGLNPHAEKIVNELGVCMTEEKLFPFTPVGVHAHQQGVNAPNIFGKHEIVNEKTSGYVNIVCPQDHSFTKLESRRGKLVRVRKTLYIHPEWERMVRACMQKQVAKLNWNIYPADSRGEYHIYLNCNLPAPNGGKGVALYVPITYLSTGEWQQVVDLHERVAVGYYKGAGFRVEAMQLVAWQNMTRLALHGKDAEKLRRIVERI